MLTRLGQSGGGIGEGDIVGAMLERVVAHFLLVMDRG